MTQDTSKTKKGPGRPKGDYVSYEDARKWVRSLHLENLSQWHKFVKMRFRKGKKRGLKVKPRAIPANPRSVYGDQWVSDTDFLGTEKKFLTFEQARKFARRLAAEQQINSSRKWYAWRKETKPSFVPHQPDVFYKDEWQGWADFLGTNNKQATNNDWWPYEQAKQYVHKLGLRTVEDWFAWRGQMPSNVMIPKLPDRSYKEWVSWPDFLGKNATAAVETKLSSITELVIVSFSFLPSNVLYVLLDRTLTAKHTFGNDEDSTVIKVLQFSTEKEDEVRNLIEQISGGYYQFSDPSYRITQNKYAFISSLEQHLKSEDDTTPAGIGSITLLV